MSLVLSDNWSIVFQLILFVYAPMNFYFLFLFIVYFFWYIKL